MRTFRCTCDNKLFFANTTCVNCGGEVGMCARCRRVVSFGHRRAAGVVECPAPDCGASLVKCANNDSGGVCNEWIAAGSEVGGLCEFCRLTSVIPDLSVEGNREKWQALEAAKRRVLYMMQMLGMPLTAGDSGVTLAFEFKADAEENVYTGHNAGIITINIREADSVERERVRLQFGEPQRTLVGHFRHELGHYIWERLVKVRADRFRELFGDERTPSYADALERYHREGPVPGWQSSYVSAYATMHPWEDFAETFNAYLDMVSVLDTADDFGILQPPPAGFDAAMKTYQRIGVLANEWNRDLGLSDLVPEVFTPPVVEKLRYVDSLRSIERGSEDRPAGSRPILPGDIPDRGEYVTTAGP